MSKTIWVVDDDHSVRFVLSAALRDAGYSVKDFDGADAALRNARTLMDEDMPAAVFTDVRMPGTDGFGFLQELKKRNNQLPVIVMSAYTDVGTTASAFRGGAQEYISKPFDLDEVLGTLLRVLPEQVNSEDSDQLKTIGNELIGKTTAMRELFRSIGKLAQVPLSVLITGETGTGKELVARALHRESPRAQHAFIALNTAAIPSELLESELFGHEAGAFTGAQKRHIGRFEQANGGTLFLDEIGDMPALLQTRLLRVLAEGEFFRVGGRELIKVDVRVIAATHQNLEARVAAGAFRADLLHRLDVVRLQVPALRERSSDVPLLVEHFLQNACQQLKMPRKKLASDAATVLQQYAWPGNVRELENTMWRIAALASGEHIHRKDVLSALRKNTAPAANDWKQDLAVQVRNALIAGDGEVHARFKQLFDETVLQAALDITDGHRQHAAEKLGVGRNTLTRKIGSSRDRKTS